MLESWLNASSSNRSPPDLPEPDTSAFHLQESHVPAKRLRVMDEFEDEDSDCDVTAMITQYLSSNEKPNDAERADPLLLWKNSPCKELASLARTYLTASASSVPCESMFSITGFMLNGRQSSLAPHNFNRLIFIHHNAKVPRNLSS
jgi:hypothetical protein